MKKKQIMTFSAKTYVASVEDYKVHAFALYSLIIQIKLLFAQQLCFEAHGLE